MWITLTVIFIVIVLGVILTKDIDNRHDRF
jgi:hypothetical protein